MPDAIAGYGERNIRGCSGPFSWAVPEEALDRLCVERIDATDLLQPVEGPIRGHKRLDTVGHTRADMESVVRSQARCVEGERQSEGLVGYG